MRQIEVIENPSLEDITKITRRSMPVLVTGLTMGWCSDWSLDSLVEDIGDTTLPARWTDDEFKVFFDPRGGLLQSERAAVEMTVAEYVERIRHLSAREARPPMLGNIPIGNPRSGDSLASRLRGGVDFPWLDKQATSQEIRIWICASGQRSTIHNDPSDNRNIGIVGSKRWLLFPPRDHFKLYAERLHEGLWVSQIDPDCPDYVRYPAFRGTDPIEVIQRPGDMLYIPAFWWHQAQTITTAVNVNCWEEPGPGFWTRTRAERLQPP